MRYLYLCHYADGVRRYVIARGHAEAKALGENAARLYNAPEPPEDSPERPAWVARQTVLYTRRLETVVP